MILTKEKSLLAALIRWSSARCPHAASTSHVHSVPWQCEPVRLSLRPKGHESLAEVWRHGYQPVFLIADSATTLPLAAFKKSSSTFWFSITFPLRLAASLVRLETNLAC